VGSPFAEWEVGSVWGRVSDQASRSKLRFHSSQTKAPLEGRGIITTEKSLSSLLVTNSWSPSCPGRPASAPFWPRRCDSPSGEASGWIFPGSFCRNRFPRGTESDC